MSGLLGFVRLVRDPLFDYSSVCAIGVLWCNSRRNFN